MKKLILFFLISFISCSKSTVNEPKENYPTNEEFTLNNLNYGSNNQQVLDLYLPLNRSSTSTKVIVLIHGGGWTGGEKKDMDDTFSFLKKNNPGYAIANINYRLANFSSPAFPMQIDDIDAALNFLKTKNFNISNQFALVGISAGAHLSMLYAYTKNKSNVVKAVASIVGPTDITDKTYSVALTTKLVFGYTYNENPGFFKEISPLFTATSVSPPTLMLYGNKDPLVPIDQGQNLQKKLDELGVYNELKLYEGGHLTWSLPDIFDAYTKLSNFIKLKF